ncbi:unnamed protein product, partial [Phaeothamnion confervicola]
QVIANHIVDPRIVLVPNAGSDRSWVWTAFDFHDGNLAEVGSVHFACGCSNSRLWLGSPHSPDSSFVCCLVD